VRLGARLKVFLFSVGLVALAVLVADAYLEHAIQEQLTEQIHEDLSIRAALVAREASANTAGLDDVEAWDRFADDVGATTRTRVTIVRRDGTVLGDSEEPPSRVRTMENHGEREEVVRALATGYGDSSRMSATTHVRSLYVAVPFAHGGVAAAGLARVAEPLEDVDRALGEIERFLLVGSAAGLAIAGLLSAALTRRTTEVVALLTDAAQRMTSGDLAVRTRVRGHDELAELGGALDALAGSLATSLEELRTERDLQAHILEGMQEGVLVVDREGRVVLVNPALRGMLLLGAHAVGRPLLEVVRNDELQRILERARSERVSLGEIELPGIKPRRLLVRATALEGDEVGLLAVIVDVTDLRRLETLRRDFVANVSHELRTPVTAVLSATETLRAGAVSEPEAAARFLDIVERNAQRLQALIEDLLELSRLESKEFRLRRERVDLGAVAPVVLGMFRERAEKKGVRLEADVASPAPVLETDPRALELVLSNLVDNAVKYCPSGTSVCLSARGDGEQVRLSVADTGPGIAQRHLPRLFERFYRVDAGRSRDVGGTGLGLSIVKHLVEAMGGTVTVESAVGRGSTFSVTLPSGRAADAS